MFPEGNVPGYVCNPGSPRERDAASQGHTSGIPTRAMLHSWKLAPAAHHVLLSILVMTSPHLTSGRQFWLITHMIQSWTTLMAFPIASRRSVSFPRGTRVTYVTWDVLFIVWRRAEIVFGLVLYRVPCQCRALAWPFIVKINLTGKCIQLNWIRILLNGYKKA